MLIRVKRPVIWITFAYIIGILVGVAVNKKFVLLFWTAAFLLSLAAWFSVNKNGSGFILIMVAFGLMGIITAQTSLNVKNPLDNFTGTSVSIKGQIVDSPRYMDGRDVYVVNVFSVAGRDWQMDVKTKVQVTVYHNAQPGQRIRFYFGDIVEVRGLLQQPPGQRNPRGFDYRAYLQRRGIFNTMAVDEYGIRKTGVARVSVPQSWLHTLRTRAGKVLDSNVGGREGELLKTMLLGQKWLLPVQIQQDFQKTGLSHVLAISGLHLGFILMALNGIVRLLHLTKKQAFVFVTGILSLYCALVGAAPSVMRATIMAVLVLGSRVAGRQSDTLNNVFAAALLILLFRPMDLFEVGFQLSFGAVIGIVFYYRYFENILSFLPRKIASGLSVTMSAQLGVWPLIAYYFNTFSIIAVLANLILVPLSGFLVMLGFVMITGAMVIPVLGRLMAPLIKLLCALLIKGNEIFAALPWTFVRVISPSLIFMTCYYLVFWFLSQNRPLGIRYPLLWCCGLIIAALAVSILVPIIDNDLYIVFLDVGQGDCIYIRTPDERHILIDGGGKHSAGYTGTFDVGEDVVVPFLLKNGVWNLDLVVMSHAHNDHIEGLVSVLESIPVKAFMEYPPGEDNENYVRIKELVAKNGIRNIYAHEGFSYRIGKDVWLEVMYPPKEPEKVQTLLSKGDNNRSLLLLLRYQGTGVLFTGDIESDVEQYLAPEWNGNVDVLKVAHHGSNTSTADEWLEAVKPQLAIIQVGKNSFGHPHSQVLQRLEQRGVRVLRNDHHGAVMASYRNGQWHVRVMVNEPLR